MRKYSIIEKYTTSSYTEFMQHSAADHVHNAFVHEGDSCCAFRHGGEMFWEVNGVLKMHEVRPYFDLWELFNLEQTCSENIKTPLQWW